MGGSPGGLIDTSSPLNARRAPQSAKKELANLRPPLKQSRQDPAQEIKTMIGLPRTSSTLAAGKSKLSAGGTEEGCNIDANPQNHRLKLVS